jgi:glycosyltransferase involved in cell wall biosynthesis
MPKVSVILTSYNHEKYIREAIDSVLAQTLADFELIIWDDASNDASWTIINSYADPRIRSFRNEERRRAAYGLNKTISEMVQSEYIAIHHSDDIWEADKLAKQVTFLDEHPEFGAVFTHITAIGEDSKPLKNEKNFYNSKFEQPNRTRFEWLHFFFHRGNALCHPSVLIRKNCYDSCGLYRFGFAQLADFDMWVRLCLKYEIHVLPEKLVCFRVRADEANASSIRPESYIRNTTEFYTLLKNYLKIESFEELVTIFPEAAKYYRADGFDLQYVLAMIALEKKPFSFTELFGIGLLFEAVADPVRSKTIKAIYNFDYLDLINLSGKCDVFKASLRWRALLIYCRIRDKIFPVTSNRRKAAKFIWHIFTRVMTRTAGKPDQRIVCLAPKNRSGC